MFTVKSAVYLFPPVRNIFIHSSLLVSVLKHCLNYLTVLNPCLCTVELALVSWFWLLLPSTVVDIPALSPPISALFWGDCFSWSTVVSLSFSISLQSYLSFLPSPLSSVFCINFSTFTSVSSFVVCFFVFGQSGSLWPYKSPFLSVCLSVCLPDCLSACHSQLLERFWE